MKSKRPEEVESTDRAVSPVIGVILMVAITVILAAVIAAFVLDIGPTGETAPNAQLSIEETATADEGDEIAELTIEHNGGDSVSLEDFDLVVDGTNEGNLEEETEGPSVMSVGETATLDTSEDEIWEDVDEGDEIELIWDSSQSFTSHTMTEDAEAND